MRKKAKKKTYRKSPSSFSFLRVIYITFVMFLVFGLAFFYFKGSDKEICANSISCVKDLTGKYESSEKEGVFMGKAVSVPTEIAITKPLRNVLGQTSVSNKHIYVDLTNQRLYAYEGSNLIYNFLVSTGKWGRTPTGSFNIWIKLRYTRMSGGNPAIGTYYNLPNVPFVMFFYNNEVPKSMGYSLHGTYWHNNFGHPMSHGCVNMRIEEAEKIYYWADPPVTGNTTYVTKDTAPSTPITIYGEASQE